MNNKRKKIEKLIFKLMPIRISEKIYGRNLPERFFKKTSIITKFHYMFNESPLMMQSWYNRKPEKFKKNKKK